jgi:hypothetical protein
MASSDRPQFSSSIIAVWIMRSQVVATPRAMGGYRHSLATGSGLAGWRRPMKRPSRLATWHERRWTAVRMIHVHMAGGWCPEPRGGTGCMRTEHLTEHELST